LFIRQRIFIILTKIRYFCQYKTNLPVQQRLILLGFVLINGQKIRNPYFSVWILDMLELTYQLYFYEWRYFYFLRELNKLRWYGIKKGFKYLHPYMFKNKQIFADRFKQWYISSTRCPVTIVTRMMSKFWFYRVLPKFYNFFKFTNYF